MNEDNLRIGYIIVSNYVMKENRKINFLYRETPDNDQDSGWRIFSGDEDEIYTENAHNFAIYDAYIVCQKDPAIAPLLRSPYITAYERSSETDLFELIEDFILGED